MRRRRAIPKSMISCVRAWAAGPSFLSPCSLRIRRNTSAVPSRRPPWRKESLMSEPARTLARAALVESIPVGLEDLRATPGVQYTEDTLVRLTTEARSTIDLTAMYWALLPDPDGDDEKG